jgi:hypothetical protein
MSLLDDGPQLGVQTPRVLVVPKHSSNEADHAIYLASAYGLHPDEWQRLVLTGWLGVLENKKWSAPRVGLSVPRQNGKNAILEIRELYGMVALGRRILHTAHEVKTARKAFLRLLEFFDNHRFPELKDLVKEIRRTNGQEAIYLHNGGGVEFVARSKGSGRGFTVDDLVMDEAQDLSDDTYAALLPTISSSPTGNPQQILTGTPPGDGTRGEVFTRARAGAVAGTSSRLCWMEWSAGPQPGLDDPAAWAEANPALGMRPNAVQWDAIKDEREAMDDITFARERLGVWEGAGTSAVIDADVWQALGDRSSAPTDPVALAIDVAPDHSKATIAVAARRSDKLFHVEIIEARAGTGWVPDRLAEIAAKQNPCATVVDPGGPAGSLLAALDTVGVATLRVSGREYAQACGAFLTAVADGKLRHQLDPRLTTAVDAGRKRPLGDAWAWHRRDAGTDLTPLVAVTLALHGLAVKGNARKSRGVFGF